MIKRKNAIRKNRLRNRAVLFVFIADSKPAPPKNNLANALICHDCGSTISQKVADYSQAKFGKFLCYD